MHTPFPKQHVVVAYDISSNKTRKTLVKLLRGYGVRVNYSVFECRIGKTELSALKMRIEKIINPKQDTVLFYLLCGKCAVRREQSGLKKGRYNSIV